jgi:hypothetical protein
LFGHGVSPYSLEGHCRIIEKIEYKIQRHAIYPTLSFLLDNASQEIEIETITMNSYETLFLHAET